MKGLDTAVEHAVDARGRLVGSGNSMALTYVDAAVRSLRFAQAILSMRAGTDAPAADPRGDPWVRITFCNGMPTSVFLRHETDTGTWVRGVAVPGGGAVRPQSAAECDWRTAPSPDLGREILESGTARAIVQGPVGAALLFDALANFPWFYPATATRWTAGVAAARSLIAALAEGRAPLALHGMLAARHVDRDVLAMIESLGWRRDPSGLFSPLLRASNGMDGFRHPD